MRRLSRLAKTLILRHLMPHAFLATGQ